MPAAHELGEVFLGVTPKPIRLYLKDLFAAVRDRYDRLVLPCAGKFADVEMAIAAGWNPSQIETSDISLFSSLLGFSLAGRPLSDLGIEFHSDIAALNSYRGTAKLAGATLVGMKIAQLTDGKVYEPLVRADLLANLDRHVELMQAKIDGLVSRCAGIRYQIRDVTAHIAEVTDDPRAILFTFPPSISKGYDRMFDWHGRLTWESPSIPNWDPKTDRERLIRQMMGSKGLALVGWLGLKVEEIPDGTVFCMQQKMGKNHVLTSNRKGECDLALAARKITDISPASLPLLRPDHEITVDSSIAFVPTTREHALYYRDLLVHELGVSRAESYTLVLVDGYLVGVFGYFSDHLRRGQDPVIREIFAMTVPSKRYPRLIRLLRRLLVSEQSARWFKTHLLSAMLEVEEFQSTCIAKGPDVMANRGLMKLVDKKQRPDGKWHLNYRTPFHPWDWKGAIKLWREDMRRQQKATGRDLGVPMQDPPKKGKGGANGNDKRNENGGPQPP